MVGINVGGVALTVSFHVLFFVSRGGKFENVDERTEVYLPTRLIVPLIIRAIYHAFAYRGYLAIFTYSSTPFPPQSAQFPLSSFLFFPTPSSHGSARLPSLSRPTGDRRGHVIGRVSSLIPVRPRCP